MNLACKAWISEQYQEDKYKILDLFGGNGNLSSPFKYDQRLVVDTYSNTFNEEFFSQDLFDESAVHKVMDRIKFEPNLLIVDPPRAGVKNLEQWVQAFPANQILYVSCDPHTLARDLRSIKDKYQIEKLALFDFFPGTFHFETVAILRRAY